MTHLSSNRICNRRTGLVPIRRTSPACLHSGTCPFGSAAPHLSYLISHTLWSLLSGFLLAVSLRYFAEGSPFTGAGILLASLLSLFINPIMKGTEHE